MALAAAAADLVQESVEHTAIASGEYSWELATALSRLSEGSSSDDPTAPAEYWGTREEDGAEWRVHLHRPETDEVES